MNILRIGHFEPGERVVLIEFQDERPSTIVTLGPNEIVHTYYVEWCSRDRRLYYDMAGFGGDVQGGGSSPYWLAPGVICEGAKPELRLPELPAGIDLDAPFAGMEEERCTGCAICDDQLPLIDASPCEHLHWCDLCNWWCGPGAPEGQCVPDEVAA